MFMCLPTASEIKLPTSSSSNITGSFFTIGLLSVFVFDFNDSTMMALFALADLDNAYKSGKLTEAAYHKQRQEIKNHLRTIWEIE